MTNVRFESLSKTFGTVTALHCITMEVGQGEFMALVGPSGCGKSTLLRTLAGLEEASGGKIFIGEHDVTQTHPKDRDTAMVFQSYALYPHMDVEANMGFALRLAKLPERDVSQQVTTAAAKLGVTPLLKRYPKELSGGQRQRVAMGRAIVRNPSVFLFDEPLSNLDAALRVQMRGEIKRLQQQLGTTTVYVTHDQVEAMTMADRICVLRGGKIEQIGTPLDLYDRPVNKFVAGFIGSPAMNFIPARIGDAGLIFAFCDEALAPPAGLARRPLQDVEVGFRPNSMVVADRGLPFEVSLVEPTGAETLLSGRMGGIDATFIFQQRLSIKAGDRLFLRPQGDVLHLFDPQTSLRVPAEEKRAAA